MRRYLTFFAIAVMTLGLGFLLLTRPRTRHDAPELVSSVPEGDAGDSGAALEAGRESPAGDAAPNGDGAADDGGTATSARPLRVTSLGWEHVAAGVAMTAPDGGPTIAPSLELAPETTLEAVSARLARGGADPEGADVAILPLPAFVVAYERLRALSPRVFLVISYSHGGEEVRTTSALVEPPPGDGEVRLAALGASPDDAARAAGSESATVLGLFALDLLGVRPSRVRLVPLGTEAAKTAPFAALTSSSSDERKLALSTADASRFVPVVAVAPAIALDARPLAYAELARGWLEGLALAAKDASTVARRLAGKEALPLARGVGGAPEAIALLERLGRVEAASMETQGRMFGRSPASLEVLAQRTWQLARGGGLTATAAPEPLPIEPRIVKALGASLAGESPAPAGASGAAFGSIAKDATLLVVHRVVEGDVAQAASAIELLSEIFPRASFRVRAKGGQKAARAIAEQAAARVPAGRIAVAPGEPRGAFAAVDVVSAH